MVRPTYGIHKRLTELAHSTPDAPFILASTEAPEFTYGQFEDIARRTADVFSQLGVSRGDRVHVQLENGWEYLAALFGAAFVGAVLVPTSPRSTVDDVAFATSQSDCVLSIMPAADARFFEESAELAPSLRALLTVGPDGPQPHGALSFSSAIASATPHAQTRLPYENELLAILYTSGVTGWPKGVMLTHANMRHAGSVVAGHVRLIPEDRWLISLPLSHLNALGYSIMSALNTGASVGFSNPRRGWVESAIAQRSTVGSLFSESVRALLNAGAPGDGISTSLRTVLFAQHLTREERGRFTAQFGAELLQMYGSTESVAPVIADSPFHVSSPNSVGVPLPHATIRLVNQSGEVVGVGEPGELLVHGERGRTLADGYFARDDLTDQTFMSDWLRTGDQFIIGDDGHAVFLGRAADILKPGAESVSAMEVERVISEHPGVAEVAVIGIDSPAGGEGIGAYIVLRDEDATVTEVAEWLRTRLAPHKAPTQWRIVPSLPRSPVGKVLKDMLRRGAPMLDEAKSDLFVRHTDVE